MANVETAVISANLGGFEVVQPHAVQSVPAGYYLFTDKNFPPRHSSMLPRLQARIPKMFSYQMAPGYKYYLWVDSSCILSDEDSLKFFIDQLGDNDIALLKHPARNTIGEEAEYLKMRLAMPDRYITSRYKNELLDAMMDEINDPSLPLYATTAYIYRDSYDMRKMLKEWWYGTSRYHTIDQIWLPYALKQYPHLKVRVIQENFLKCDYLKPTRK